MRWLQKSSSSSSQAPQLIGLSPIKSDDSLSISTHSINLIDQKHETNYETSQSTRKSRKDFASLRTLTWSRKFARSNENCYNIQAGRVIDRSREGQCNTSISSHQKLRSSSPSNQSISSIQTISTSTPTYFTALRRLHRYKQQPPLASVVDFDKEVWRVSSEDDDRSIIEVDACQTSNKSELIRVQQREKRNPLIHTRLSCYKPIISGQQVDFNNLKNFKSIDDFLSIDMSNAHSSMDHINDAEITKMIEKEEKHKRKGIGSKFRTMSDKTQKLFSKFYHSNSNLKSAVTESTSDVTCSQRRDSDKLLCRQRSLSHGTLSQVKEFDAKKNEGEDGDSGIILINETTSGASSMTDESAESTKKIEETFRMPPERKYVQRIEIKYDDENDESKETPKICATSLTQQHNASCSDLSLQSSTTVVVEKRQKNHSVESGLNETSSKRNSVTEIVAMLEKNDNNNTKFNTLNHPRRPKGTTTLVINQVEDVFDDSLALNMCDDDKLKLKTAQSKEKIDDNVNDKQTMTPNSRRKIQSSNFCTLPRKAKTSPHCTFHTVTFEKGSGKKALGFTIVGGADSPRGALGIFIKSIMPKGQAIENGLLKAGDEILAVNGNVCHDLTHQDAIKLFKSVKCGEIVLNICRRKKS